MTDWIVFGVVAGLVLWGLARGSGVDVCLMQLRGAPEAALTDRRACIHEGVKRMRRSLAACGAGRDGLAAYASWLCFAGLKESRAMMDLAGRIQ